MKNNLEFKKERKKHLIPVGWTNSEESNDLRPNSIYKIVRFAKINKNHSNYSHVGIPTGKLCSSHVGHSKIYCSPDHIIALWATHNLINLTLQCHCQSAHHTLKLLDAA